MGMQALTNACVLYDKGKKQIVLCYQGDVEEEAVREYLLTMIPKYMVPTVYHKLIRFPYNDNGKIDRKMLGEEYIK